MLYLFNTLTRKIEEFRPIDPENIKMYSCGPTVYDYQHIGHMRRYIGDDILVRTLKDNGYRIKHVMNITDVGHLVSDADIGEDKMEKGAKKLGMTVWEIAKMFEEQFFNSIDKINIERPDVVMRATDHIKDQIELIEILEEKGFTYETDEAVYFDVSKFPNYGKLSGQKLEDKMKGVRDEVYVDKKKRNPADFALWFKRVGRFKDHTMHWDSPWGDGFPGWHIECSAMSMRALGPTLDIHTGGIDHLPIHHPNEIAQSEAASGVKFVNYWVHHAFLLVEGQKMSKSLENTYTVDDVKAKGFNPLSLRYLFLQTHYRQEMNFTWEAIAGAQTALYRLYEIASSLGEPKIGCAEYENKFYEAVNNDLDTPNAISLMWDLLRSKNPPFAKAATLYKMDEVLGLKIKESSAKLKNIPDEIIKLAKERENLRKAKKFLLADHVRIKIEKRGFIVKDSEKGYKVIRKI